jgi:uncharacterized protein YbjT (DUF2867 family)
MKQQVVTVVGGTGFVGRYVVKLLAAQGYTVRVIARRPDLALYLKTAGDVGQVVLMSGNIAKPQSLVGKLEGSYAVVNLVGVLFSSGRQNFSALHAHGAEKLAQMAHAAGVQKFIQISALGADRARNSSYARTKLLGEKAVMAAFPGATIVRPSIIFGPEDEFYNQFATMASLSPALPLIGGGRTKFQPVYVGDVAQAVVACIEQPDAQGRIYELGGPHIYSFREILAYIQQLIGTRRVRVPLPFMLASLIAPIARYLPPPLRFSRDQVKLLKTDNVVSHNANGFAQLGIMPTAVEVVVPEYLARFSGRFNRKVA